MKVRRLGPAAVPGGCRAPAANNTIDTMPAAITTDPDSGSALAATAR
ncbi:hypothetical protein [Embleya sp. NPDC055610]